MLEPIKFRAVTEDGSVTEGRIELPDQIAIERNFDCSILQVFSEHSAERLAYGAWYHLRRKKKIADTTEFDPWFNSIVELKDSGTAPDVFTEEPDADPKDAAKVAPIASSRSSRTG